MTKKQPTKSKKKVSVKEQLQECQAQSAEHLAGWQRAQADYQNLKKQAGEEKEQLARFVKAQVLTDFFPIIDNFNLAMEHVPQDAQSESWVQGLLYLKTQFEKTLEDMQVKKINVLGKQFDVDMMEAVEEKEDKAAESGIVIKELRAGYTLDDTVIAPAKVIVAK